MTICVADYTSVVLIRKPVGSGHTESLVRMNRAGHIAASIEVGSHCNMIPKMQALDSLEMSGIK
jgi:hypothetical protein